MQMLLRFLFLFFPVFSFASANAQLDSTVTFVKKNNFSKACSAYKGCYCACIPMKGKSVEGILIGADSSRIYLAEGKIILGVNDTVNFYDDYTLDLNSKNWIATDTVSFLIRDLYRVVTHQRPGDHVKSKMDKFIESIFDTPSSSRHGNSFLGACIIAFPFAIITYPTEYFLHPNNRKVHSFDLRIWEVKR
jgi:hypothetical protein